jgi:Protein of unknown function (DUF3251)
MNLKSSRCFWPLVAILFSACERPPEAVPRMDALEEKIRDLEQRVNSQEHETSELNHRVFMNYLDFRERIEELKEKKAAINPSSTGYSFLDTGGGVLLVSCEGAEQYLDGHRIKLRIGNPLNMRFSGFKLKFKFGRKPPEPPTDKNTNEAVFQREAETWLRNYATWKASLREAEGSYTADLSPGAWRAVQATLPQTKAEDIAYVEVSIETDIVSLKAP